MVREYGLQTLAVLLWVGAVTELPAQTKIRATDLAVNGESFFAASNIASELTRLARVDGAIGNDESFRQIAVSGTLAAQILNQYKNSNPKPVYLISDGGGNDLMQSCEGAPTPQCGVIRNTVTTVQQYFDAMKAGGTQKVLWMRYPDPQGTRWATLKANHDVFNPEVEKICRASTVPKCLWVDLRPVWEGHYAQYTTDGIHATNAGGTATAQAFWKAMKENNFFDLAATPTLFRIDPSPPALQGQWVSRQSLFLSLFLAQAAPVKVRITTVSGRAVLEAKSQEGSGFGIAQFPLGAVIPGPYLLEVQAGASRKQTRVWVP